MKILNYKICLFLLSTLFIGCMPDSLTKFKKEAEVKPIPPLPATVITTEEGETYDLADVVNIANFHYINSSTNEAQSAFYTKTNTSLSMSPVMDGTFGIAPENLKERLFVSCSISPALPYGMNISSSSSAPCKIEGTPTAKSFTQLLGQLNSPVNYTVTLKTRGTNGIVTNSLAAIQIGVYDDVVDFHYDHGESLLVRVVTVSPEVLDEIELNNNPAATYTEAGFVTSVLGQTGVIKSIDKATGMLGVKKLLPLRITNYNNFKISEVNSIDENVGAREPMFICAPNAGNMAMAKVIKVPPYELGVETIFVEMLTNTRFPTGPGSRIKLIKPTPAELSNGAPLVKLCPTLPGDYVADNTIVSQDIPYFFNVLISTSIDFDLHHYETKADIQSVQMALEFNQNIGVAPSVYPAITVVTNSPAKMQNSTNGVVYSVSPSLPPGFSISPTTGELTGKFQTLFNSAAYMITAKNPISSKTTPLILNSLYAPKDLSYTTNQFISISNLSDIFEGILLREVVSAPMAPESAILAKVINKYTHAAGSKLSINTLNGKTKFESNFRVPNPVTSFIPKINKNDVANYNVALVVPGVLHANYTVGKYIKAVENDAFARITYVHRSAGRNVIFAQQVMLNSDTQLPPFAITNAPLVSNDICLTDAARSALCTNAATVGMVEANNLILQTSAVPNLANHFQFVSPNNASSGKLEAYAPNKYLLSDIAVSPVSAAAPYPLASSRSLIPTDSIGHLDNDDALTGLVPITHTHAAANIFILETGEYREIHPNTLHATYTNYFITPELPDGLFFNKATGLISGVPTKRAAKRFYKVSATNLVGQSSYFIELEVRDFFKVRNITASPSQHMHLAGLNRSTKECKIDSNEILNRRYNANSADSLDASCILDIEESDLHIAGINLQVSVGDSLCTAVEFEPYSFQNFPTQATNPVAPSAIYYKDNTEDCTPAGPPLPAQTPNAPDTTQRAICIGNYTQDYGPNCDDGSVTYIEREWKLVGGVCTAADTTTVTDIPCGGSKYNCRQGAIRDVLTPEAIMLGNSRVGEYAYTGLSKDFPISSGPSGSNLHVANAVVNSCMKTSRNDSQALMAYINNPATLATESPFAHSNPYYSFYCKDSSGTTIARIKVVVREWDLKYNLTSFLDQFNPDATLGANPILNRTGTDGFGSAYNNHLSWDNLNPTPAACNVDTATTAQDYEFPELRY